MIIKKFVAKTEEEATEAAKKELGSGIVIMNVKVAKRKGIAGLLGAKQTEVTVALEENRDSLKSVRRDNATKETVTGEERKKEQSLTANPVGVMGESSQNIEKKLDSLQTLLVNRFEQEKVEKAEKTDSSMQGNNSVQEEKAEKIVLDTNKQYEDMTVEELQEAILKKMRQNGPVSDYMLGTVRENKHHGSLVIWVKSFG